MCKLVKVELESFCQIGNGSWPVVQTIAMVLEIIGRNNNYPLCALATSGRLALGHHQHATTMAGSRTLATN